MDEMIRCPSCSEINSSDQEFCQSCQARLQPLTGSFDGADAPLVSGQIPNKKKNTAELEPILPQWLRDARTQSRETSQEEDGVQNLQPPKSSAPVNPPPAPVDLLAGLQSQSDDDNEDETPDWLASITGVSSKAKKTEHEPSDVRWVEVGGKEDFAQDEPFQKADNKSPDWLNDIQSQPKSDKDELTDWFKETSNSSSQAEPWAGESSKSNDVFKSTEETPDWLRQMQVNDDAKNKSTAFKEEPSSAIDDNSTDWLKSLGTDNPFVDNAVQPEPSLNFGDDLPNWLDSPNLQTQSQSVESAPSTESTNSENEASLFSVDDAPDWLKNTSEAPKENPIRKKTAPLWLKDDSNLDSADDNVPAWLSPDAPVINQPPAIEVKSQQEEAEFGDIPNWLKAAAPQSSIFSEPAVEQEPSFSSDAPDWLSTLKSVESSQPASPFETEANNDVNLTAPAFTSASFEQGSDPIFTEMPDWLSNVAESPAVDPVVNNADSISAGELPSWVQAMRPLDNGIAQSTQSFSNDQTLESRGALAGLQGVLPSVPGYAPSSKPKAYSILLRATDEQQSQALLLEQIFLAAEAQPQPIASYKPLVASPSLRWFISLAVFIFLTIGITVRTPIFAMPLDVPNGLKGALDVAQNIPEGAPVLVVIDYQPAHAAELEVTAAPMLDQMDLLRHPNLFFVSMNETGAALTERLLSLPSLRDRYQGEFQFTNLGYLPGGEMGIRAFMQDPYQTIPVDINRNPTLLQANISIVQFVAVIILTDSADTSRSWIEQAAIATYPMPFPAPIVLITSAQAGPMNEPYYVSGQVKGIVNGLSGAAIFEQNNAGRPGTARTYWDAYNLGSLLAMLMLVLGGLWNLALGVRDRSLARELK